MRIIEKQMLAAIEAGTSWQGGNTTVSFTNHGMGVYLHCNLIAFKHDDGEPMGVDTETLKDYPTKTTCSRLRALGFDVSVKCGVPHLNGKPVI